MLLDVPSDEIAAALPRYGQPVAEGLEIVRTGDIHIIPGFDGQYGAVRVWPDGSAPGASNKPPGAPRLLSYKGR